MYYKLSQIKKDVRSILDENEDGNLLFDADIDTLSLNTAIDGRICDAVRSITYSAPLHLINESELLPCDEITWHSDEPGVGGGSVKLPKDFLRLVLFQMSDWAVPVTEAIGAESPKYALQKSPFTGIRGNVNNPVVAVVHRGGNNILEFYSCRDGANVSVLDARYLREPEVIADEVFIPSRLYTPVLYECAYLVGVSMNVANAEALRNTAKEYLMV